MNGGCLRFGRGWQVVWVVRPWRVWVLPSSVVEFSVCPGAGWVFRVLSAPEWYSKSASGQCAVAAAALAVLIP